MPGKKMMEQKKDKKAMPAAVLLMLDKSKPLPKRGGRTATNKANKK